MNTASLISYFKELWNQCPGDFPSYGTVYSLTQQKERESLFTSYIDKFKKVREEAAQGKGKPDQERFFRAFGHFMKGVYDYSDEALDIILHPDMLAVSRSFSNEARAFDPGIKPEEIYQSMRNVWIMNSLQLLLGQKARITPSILAYSLLYPYSDNILDNPAVTHHDKLMFSERFEKRLTGEGEMAENQIEKKISDLVGMIENQFPREEFPDVHDSLMAIHQAQTRSLRLSKNNGSLSPEEVLSISFDKGGSSVLADGFLVTGHLSPEIRRFFFGFGIWLQLVDDIQDISEDHKSGTRTLFSVNEKITDRINLTNKTMHFGRSVMNDIKCINSDICIPFSKVILQSIETMLIQSVGLNDTYYLPEYCMEMERFSPLGFAFLQETRKKGSPGRLRLITQWMESNL